MASKITFLVEKLHEAQNNNDIDLEIDALISIGKYHFEHENYQQAILIFSQILELSPEELDINYFIALSYLHMGEENKSIDFLTRELKYNPKNIKAQVLKEKVIINSNYPFVTLSLLFLNTLVFYFTYPKISITQIADYTLSYSSIGIANAFTSLFFHINSLHYALNMIILLIFGLMLEKNIGSFKFLLIYISSGMFGNVMQAIISPDAFILGASASLFGLLGATLMREPLLKIRVLGLIKMPMIIFMGVFFIISGLLQQSFTQSVSTGEFAHMMGFLFAVLITGLFYNELIEHFYNWLAIFFGFWIVWFFSLSLINISIISFGDIFYYIIMILFGFFLVFYSYINLVAFHKLRDEIVRRAFEK